MLFESKPYGKEYRFDQESNVIELTYNQAGLRIVIVAATSMFTNVFLEIHFNNINGFRMLGEENLIAYWETEKFKSNHHIYEILSGGWTSGEPLADGILSTSEFISYREWFIATTNDCVTVLSSEEPHIREFTNASISS